MNNNNNKNNTFTEVLDERCLQCRHDNVHIYISALRNTITIGHFVIVSPPQGGRSFIGQIIGRSTSTDSVELLPFLPLFSPEINKLIANIALLPRQISADVCRGMVELYRTSSVTTVRTENISGIAFIFLLHHLEKFTYHVQGMTNAFVIHFKFCGRTRRLIPLNDESFHAFLDLNPYHRQFWSECYSRTIFSSIDHLCQEFWRFLCRYGQSQGLYPKQTLNLYFSDAFTSYISNFLQRCGLQPQESVFRKPQRRVEAYFMYRMVSTEVKYHFFSLESDEDIEKITQMIGTMSMFGVRKRLPRKDAEIVIQNLDLVNAISRIDLYISGSRIKVRLCAFRHIVGDASNCNRLMRQLGTPTPHEQDNATAGVQTRATIIIRPRSKFDYMGNVYEVVEELPNGIIEAVCKRGSLISNEQQFNKDEVLHLVNQKRG
jgi:hypothetical protein